MPVHIQTASEKELQTLENIGERKARAIIQLRDMLDSPISVKLLTYASGIKEDAWEQLIVDGLIVIDDNTCTRPISDSIDNKHLANELRSMNHKLEVCYGGRIEELHQRFTMQQGSLQRQEAELHSKD